MLVKTLAPKILHIFAAERRRVVSDWRIGVVARRVAHAENMTLPDAKCVFDIQRELFERGDLKGSQSVENVYVITSPFAGLLDVSEEQIVQEANPACTFAFLTAMLYHGLTDIIPEGIYAIDFKGSEMASNRMPLGTTPEDWAGRKLPRGQQPKSVGETDVNWTMMQGAWEFGIEIGYSAGLPIYVTDVERTLVDSLRMPEKCGGIAKVFHGWRSSTFDPDRVVEYADRFGIQNLRQRVGFVLDRLGCRPDGLMRWRRGLQRGGSVRLIAGLPYAAIHSAEWNLSLNVPASVLSILDAR